MTNNIRKFRTSANPDDVIEQAVGEFEDVLIIGYDKNGNLDARCSDGLIDGGQLLWLMKNFEKKLLDGDYLT